MRLTTGWFGFHLDGTYDARDWWGASPAHVRLVERDPEWRRNGRAARTRLYIQLPYQPRSAVQMVVDARVVGGGPTVLELSWTSAGWGGGEKTGGVAWLERLDWQWLRVWTPELLDRRPPSSVLPVSDVGDIEAYVRVVFGDYAGTIMTGAWTTDLPGCKPMPWLRWGVVYSTLHYDGFDAWAITRGVRPDAAPDRWFARFQPEAGHGPDLAVLYVYDVATKEAYCFLHFRRERDVLHLVQGVFNRLVCRSDDVTPEAVDGLVRALIG